MTEGKISGKTLYSSQSPLIIISLDSFTVLWGKQKNINTLILQKTNKQTNIKPEAQRRKGSWLR